MIASVSVDFNKNMQSNQLVQLRWLERGDSKTLQYRQLLRNPNIPALAPTWTEWQDVPTVSE